MATDDADTGIALIVGLGNPGDRYAGTRHNAGFDFADALVRRAGGAFRADKRNKGEIAPVRLAGREARVLKPTTLMNRSGASVGPLAGFYKLAPERILVAHDELDLPPGTVRLKRGGGHGGHNGLRDLHRALSGKDFLRLRIGIGHPGSSADVVPYVLGRPSPDDRRAIAGAIDEAVDAMELVMAGELDKAMQRLHTAE